MSIDKMKELLGDNEKANDIISLAIDLVKAQENKGIETNTKRLDEIKLLKAKNENYSKGLDSLGVDVGGDWVSDLQKRKGKPAKADESAIEAKFVNEIDALKSSLKTLTEQNGRNKRKALEGSLLEKLSGKVLGAKTTVENLILKGAVDLNDNDEIVFKNGENVLSFSEGIDNLLKSEDVILASNQNSGSNGSSKGAESGKPQEKGFYEAMKSGN